MAKRPPIAKQTRDSAEVADLRRIHLALLKTRMVEERMLKERKSGGELSKWFSSYGQEAISVGCAMALEPDEFIFTMHRDLGAFVARGVPFDRLFAQLLGKPQGFTKGRDRSFHFGSQEFRLVGMISHIGPQLTVANGVALAHRLRREGKVSLVFTGDGGTSQGDFHEALNVASVWDLPTIFVIENNCWALSTPVEQQYRCESLVDRAAGYGMRGLTLDGNDVLEVRDTIALLAAEMRQDPRPVLVECRTWRLYGHELGAQDVASEEFLTAGRSQDPLARLETTLISRGVLAESALSSLRAAIAVELEEALEQAKSYPSAASDAETEEREVFGVRRFDELQPKTSNVSRKRLVDGVADGLMQAMELHSELVMMGQDIEFGGVFQTTKGLLERFGKDRVRNTPLCESAILGAAVGLAIAGIPSVVEIQFGDFATSAFTQLANYLPKLHWRWGQSVPVVVRMPVGAGVGAGPFHSQSNEAWFAHIAGWKVVYPSSPSDAKGLLLTAIRDSNPVIFMEHKALYRERALEEDVPDEPFTIEIGKAKVLSSGRDLSIITYGAGTLWAKQFAADHPEIDVYLLDLRTLVPLDVEAIGAAVEASGKALVVQEAPRTAGYGAHIVSVIDERFWELLDGPPRLCASLDTPVPFSKELERRYLAKSRLEQMALELAAY